VRTWTEMALITNEINKQKRHIPIRQLIQRSANALASIRDKWASILTAYWKSSGSTTDPNEQRDH